MTDPNDVFDRNLERLLRASAAPRPDPGRARAEFLARVDGRSHAGRRFAMAAAALLVAALVYSVLASRGPQVRNPLPPQDGTAAVPSTPQDPAAVAPSVPDPVRPPPMPAVAGRSVTSKDAFLMLTCTLPPPRAALPRLLVEGAASLPDGAALLLSIRRSTERFAGGKLVTESQAVPSTPLEVREGRFRSDVSWQGAGWYTARVVVSEGQNSAVAAEMKKHASKSSTFEFAGWGDELAGELAPALVKLDDLAAKAVDLVGRMEVLARKESDWVRSRKNEDSKGADVVLTPAAQALMGELSAIMIRLDDSGAARLHPATVHELSMTLQRLSGCVTAFTWNAQTGKFAGAKSYHFPSQQVETHRGEPLTFETVKRYLGEIAPLAGRETALWLVRDLRRTEAKATTEFAATLKVCEGRPGLAPVAARLGKAVVGDLDGLEKEIRLGSN